MHLLYFLAVTAATATTIFQLDQNSTWFENLALQSNGNLLVTRADTPELWSIDPTAKTGSSIASIPGVTSLFGIAPLDDNYYAVVAGNFSVSTFAPTPGSFSLWKVNLNDVSDSQKIVDIPEAKWLNGAVRFNQDPNYVLIADPADGCIWSVDVVSGTYTKALSDPAMAPAKGQPAPVGINGVRVRNEYIYFAVSTQEQLCRIPVDQNLSVLGATEVIASGVVMDDFDILQNGTAVVATHLQNTVVRLSPSGQITLVAGNAFSLEVGGATSTLYDWNRRTLYVTTNGAVESPVLGQIEPAKIVAYQLN